MAITVSGTSITFNDSTTQTTAFTGAGSSPGQSATTYTSSGSYTFTIPSGVTKIKVTVIGGGGGACGFACGTNYGGYAGNTSSVSSGSQTISTISATGGSGGVLSGRAAGGLGSGGTINARGGWSVTSTFQGGASFLSYGNSWDGSSSALFGSGGSYYLTSGSGGGGGGMAMTWLTGLTPGATLSVTVGAGGQGVPGAYPTMAGAAGVVMFEY
jgi:hypothetical protein